MCSQHVRLHRDGKQQQCTCQHVTAYDSMCGLHCTGGGLHAWSTAVLLLGSQHCRWPPTPPFIQMFRIVLTHVSHVSHVHRTRCPHAHPVYHAAFDPLQAITPPLNTNTCVYPHPRTSPTMSPPSLLLHPPPWLDGPPPPHPLLGQHKQQRVTLPVDQEQQGECHAAPI
jgi:hypothetical protein